MNTPMDDAINKEKQNSSATQLQHASMPLRQIIPHELSISLTCRVTHSLMNIYQLTQQILVNSALNYTTLDISRTIMT